MTSLRLIGILHVFRGIAIHTKAWYTWNKYPLVGRSLFISVCVALSVWTIINFASKAVIFCTKTFLNTGE